MGALGDLLLITAEIRCYCYPHFRVDKTESQMSQITLKVTQ